MNAENRSERIEKVANNTFVMGLARLMMAFGFPIVSTAAGFAISWIVNNLEANNRAVRSIEKEQVLLSTKVQTISDMLIPSILTLLNSRIDVHANRLEKIEKKADDSSNAAILRDQAQDKEIRKLLEKMYERSQGISPPQRQ